MSRYQDNVEYFWNHYPDAYEKWKKKKKEIAIYVRSYFKLRE